MSTRPLPTPDTDASFINHPRHADWVARVAFFEALGTTRSDAQSIVDVEFQDGKLPVAAEANDLQKIELSNPWMKLSITSDKETFQVSYIAKSDEEANLACEKFGLSVIAEANGLVFCV